MNSSENNPFDDRAYIETVWSAYFNPESVFSRQPYRRAAGNNQPFATGRMTD